MAWVEVADKIPHPELGAFLGASVGVAAACALLARGGRARWLGLALGSAWLGVTASWCVDWLISDLGIDQDFVAETGLGYLLALTCTAALPLLAAMIARRAQDRRRTTPGRPCSR
jgi:hypothetical protein